MKMLILTVIVCAVCFDRVHGLSCGDCNRDNLTESCGPPPPCEETVLDACGCCPLCPKTEGESCGGPWGVYGTCAKGLTCKPDSTEPPVVGAGGIYSENLDPVGTCVNTRTYERLSRPCLRELDAYIVKIGQADNKSDKVSNWAYNDGEGAASDTGLVHSQHLVTPDAPATLEYSPEFEIDTSTPAVPETTEQVSFEESTTVGCVRKPSCTPDGYYTAMQCDGCVGECWCARHEGTEIPGTRGPFRRVRC